MNRIKDPVETDGNDEQTWRQAFLYDRFGNRNFSEADTTTLAKNCGVCPNFMVCAADRKVENPSISGSTNGIIQDRRKRGSSCRYQHYFRSFLKLPHMRLQR